MDAIYYYIVVCFLIILLVLGLLFFLFQEKIIFHPEKLSPDFRFAYDNLKVEEHILETEPGVMIDFLHFKPNRPSKGLVFYLKGNTKSIKGWGKFAMDFTRLGWEVIMLDYRGFGKSTGRRNSEGMKNDIQFVYNWVKNRFPEDRIIIYGRSLGSGYAAMLAANNNPKMLILASPLYSLIKTIHRYLPFMPARPFVKYDIPTYRYLKEVKCPIKILHGSKDRLISLKTVIKLSGINPSHTRLYTILGAKHINIHKFEDYHRIIEEVLIHKPVEIDPKQTSLSYNHRK